MSIFIIAEIGINHNGDVELAKQMIDVAVESGADAVKFQKRTLDKVYTQAELDTPRESPWGTTNREQKQGLEFGVEEFQSIDSYCKEKGIEWFFSAWDVDAQVLMRQFECQYNKVASARISHMPLLEAIAAEKKHTFISTGMATDQEIADAVALFKAAGCPFELMHCVSTYPAKVEDLNLKCIHTLKDLYGCNVGYSGHETGLATSVAAAALGATSIERHLTLDRAMYGSDQAASVEPQGFKRLVRDIRAVESAMGDGVKRVLEAEKPIAAKLKRTDDL
ncbi:N-acetylneuraminate synthase family protein [Alteromonas sp. a30]|uniref:N-acetylneuraminate synthase family protein n=1 Tax=Alteromonas sp. a30 TaxID=2730917 RepID=UPI00227F2DAB|nr:N-acetylneuraminate synthase family protein [Alteromonas sp. a30]MCY7296221.1 N-acetylneuraminate synthase [Alteromonas sp. a30]